ncbi:MAG: hypothetical protein WCA95_09850 [Opitutaceae bacterium]
MTPNYLIGLSCSLLFCLSAKASDPKIKSLDPARVEIVRVALQKDLSGTGAGLSPWFDTVCVCAPKLWSRISRTLDRNGIEVIPGKFGNADGAVFKGTPGNQRLASTVEALIRGATVRLLTKEEIGRYWEIFPFEEIEEPFFVASSDNADLLIHLIWDKEKQHYTVFLIEAFRLSGSAPK